MLVAGAVLLGHGDGLLCAHRLVAGRESRATALPATSRLQALLRQVLRQGHQSTAGTPRRLRPLPLLRLPAVLVVPLEQVTTARCSHLLWLLPRRAVAGVGARSGLAPPML
jgi:hypothetical protein